MALHKKTYDIIIDQSLVRAPQTISCFNTVSFIEHLVRSLKGEEMVSERN